MFCQFLGRHILNFIIKGIELFQKQWYSVIQSDSLSSYTKSTNVLKNLQYLIQLLKT